MSSGINNTNKVRKIIGDRMQKARKRNNLSRSKFCDKLNASSERPFFEKQQDMNEERLKQWEYGNNPVELEWIPAICDVLSVDVGYLFGEYEESTRQMSDVVETTGLSENTVRIIASYKFISNTLDSLALKQKGIEKDADLPLVSFALAFSSLEEKLIEAGITMYKKGEETDYGEVLMRESLLKVAQLDFLEACMDLSRSALPVPQALDYLKELQVNALRREYRQAHRDTQGGRNGEHQED